jgi:hypothetical protein
MYSRNWHLEALDNLWSIVYNLNGYSDEKSEVLMASSNALPRAGPTAVPGSDLRPRIFVVP